MKFEEPSYPSGYLELYLRKRLEVRLRPVAPFFCNLREKRPMGRPRADGAVHTFAKCAVRRRIGNADDGTESGVWCVCLFMTDVRKENVLGLRWEGWPGGRRVPVGLGLNLEGVRIYRILQERRPNAHVSIPTTHFGWPI